MIVLYQKRRNIYEIIYAKIMMAHTNTIALNLPSHLFTIMPIILFALKAFLLIVELVFHQMTVATN